MVFFSVNESLIAAELFFIEESLLTISTKGEEGFDKTCKEGLPNQ